MIAVGRSFLLVAAGLMATMAILESSGDSSWAPTALSAAAAVAFAVTSALPHKILVGTAPTPRRGRRERIGLAVALAGGLMLLLAGALLGDARNALLVAALILAGAAVFMLNRGRNDGSKG
ncbi:hypothetical protein ACFWZ2_41060 [Streptomyces sp. NPDC059002]|uniref:hypothetical protein n=1 Tax=Streptomyces sp. NPDC059002 TaxID=3346690 RepID=UPI0036CB4D35